MPYTSTLAGNISPDRQVHLLGATLIKGKVGHMTAVLHTPACTGTALQGFSTCTSCVTITTHDHRPIRSTQLLMGHTVAMKTMAFGSYEYS